MKLFFLILIYSSQVISSDVVNLDNYYLRNFKIEKEKIIKKKIKIAVLDTGLNIHHKKYIDRIIVDSRFKRTHKHTTKIPLELIPFQKDKEDHASHIVGIITTISKNSLIMPLRVYDSSLTEEQKSKKTIRAIEFCIKEKVNIINYSIANGSFNQDEKTVLEKARKAGIFVIVSSGNESIELKNYNSYPSSYNLENIFVISGTQYNRPIGNFHKDIVDTSLPYSIYSTSKNGYKRMEGTSMSTAFFSGILARMIVKKSYSYEDIRKTIKSFTNSNSQWAGFNKNNGFLDIKDFLENKQIISKKINKIKKIELMIEKLSIPYSVR